MRALRIATDNTVAEVALPEEETHQAIREQVGTTGAVDQAVYHRQALLHVHGEATVIGLQENLVAWALASAWRGTAVYPMHGPIIVTGRTETGGVAPLDDDLAQHAYAVAHTVRETLNEWRTRRPISNEAAIQELLAYAARDAVDR
ncbi:hypothetical protein ACWCXB_29945 [Streptomyces sp. NPDC001514]